MLWGRDGPEPSVQRSLVGVSHHFDLISANGPHAPDSSAERRRWTTWTLEDPDPPGPKARLHVVAVALDWLAHGQRGKTFPNGVELLRVPPQCDLHIETEDDTSSALHLPLPCLASVRSRAVVLGSHGPASRADTPPNKSARHVLPPNSSSFRGATSGEPPSVQTTRPLQEAALSRSSRCMHSHARWSLAACSIYRLLMVVRCPGPASGRGGTVWWWSGPPPLANTSGPVRERARAYVRVPVRRSPT